MQIKNETIIFIILWILVPFILYGLCMFVTWGGNASFESWTMAGRGFFLFFAGLGEVIVCAVFHMRRIDND